MLTKESLSASIKSKMETAYGAADDQTKLQKFCDAIADAVVTEIKTNAQVVGTVTSGSGAGGSVEGTIQ